MKQIIEITKQIIGNEETNAVNARDLHGALEIKRDYSTWIKAQIKSLSLEENTDFVSFTQKGEREIGATIRKEYALTLDAAKHIAMASRTERGRQVRAYFIEVEKKFRAKTDRTYLYQLERENIELRRAINRLSRRNADETRMRLEVLFNELLDTEAIVRESVERIAQATSRLGRVRNGIDEYLEAVLQ